MGHIPYFLACLYSRAWSRSSFSFYTSSLDALECETYCIKYLLFWSFQSLGGIILLRTSTWGYAYLLDLVFDLILSDYFLLCYILRYFRIFLFPLHTLLARKDLLNYKLITILIFHCGHESDIIISYIILYIFICWPCSKKYQIYFHLWVPLALLHFIQSNLASKYGTISYGLFSYKFDESSSIFILLDYLSDFILFYSTF